MSVRRVIGFMPDDFGVYDGMKVWEFLDFFAVAYEIPRSYRKKIIGEVLELLDLTHKKDDYVNGLSKGMKQRLCLAKTLVHDPPVLILDEPASGLDPRARLEMKALLERAQADGKDDPDLEPHSLGACRLLHFDRHHRARQDAGRRQHPGNPAANPLASRHQGAGSRSIRRIGQRACCAMIRRSARLKRTITRSRPNSKARIPTWPGCSTGWCNRGIVVQSFAEEPLSLEEVFMMITKGIVN